MKKIFTFFMFVLVLNASYAQRYLEPVFDNVTVVPDQPYALNSTMLLFANLGATAKVPLWTDIYMPEGDTETDRPLVLVFHTGNFLPPILNQQIAGHRKDSSVVHVCTELAKRGYVAAAVSYRRGWNPAAQDQPTRALGLIQAAYRGVQDGRTAIRYFKATALAGGNPYGIDPEKIAVWGNGTGGYLTLGLVGLSDYNEIITTTNGTGKFLLDTDGDGVVETPMVVPAYHGDIEGKDTTIAPNAAFLIPQGDTSNFGFHTQFSSDFQLGINIGGALGDISWLNDNTTPTISVQSAFDQFAPYNDAVLIVPTTGDPIVQVQGAQQIGASQEAAGNNQPWKDFGFTDDVTELARKNSAIAGHPYYEGVLPWVHARNSLGIDEGVVINWWNPDDAAIGLGIPGVGVPHEGAPLNAIPHPSDSTLTYHTQGLILNEGMSAAKAKANLDTIFQYVLPRTCLALGLDCDLAGFSSIKHLDASELGLVISPNPTQDVTYIRTENENFNEVRVFDLQGRLVAGEDGLNTSFYALKRNSLPDGMYAVQIKFDDGVITQKLMFN